MTETNNENIKRALLCTGRMEKWSGSEIVIIELGIDLKKRGFHVDIYAHNHSWMLREKLESEALTPKNASEIILHDYLFIFTQQNALSALLDDAAIISFGKNGLPYIVYAHLSPFIDMEAPLSRLETHISARIIANSAETKARLAEFGDEFEKTIVVPNPTSSSYIRSPSHHEVSRILIVSNHLPPEMAEARDILRSNNYVVDHLGDGGIEDIISPNILHKYHAVICIGKTVQMSILSGIPVYCYDHFGGPGWLDNDNYSRAAQFNFSGRDRPTKKSSMEIATEILGYNSKKKRLSVKISPYVVGAWVSLMIADQKNYRATSIDVGKMIPMAKIDRCMNTICQQAFEYFYTSSNRDKAITFQEPALPLQDKWVQDGDGWVQIRG